MGNTIHVSRTHKGNSPIILVPLLPRSLKNEGGSWVNLFKGGGGVLPCDTQVRLCVFFINLSGVLPFEVILHGTEAG